MPNKSPQDKEARVRAHSARLDGSRYDFWAATGRGKAVLSARRDEEFVDRLKRGGLSEDQINDAVAKRSGAKEPSGQRQEGSQSPGGEVIAILPYLVAAAGLIACGVIGFKAGSYLGRRWRESR